MTDKEWNSNLRNPRRILLGVAFLGDDGFQPEINRRNPLWGL
jgi:hypothetical protein